MHGQLGPRGRARGGQNEGRLVGLHRLPRSVAALAHREKLLPADLLAGRDLRRVGAPPLDDHLLHHLVRALVLQRAAHEAVQRRVAPAPVGDIGHEEEARVGHLDPVGDRARAEAGENHQMNRADSRAGQHQRDRLEVGRHVDRHAVAAPHADRPQRRRDPLHLAQQLRVGEDALPTQLVERDQRRAAAVALLHLRIETAPREIRLAAAKPAKGRRLIGRPLEHAIPLRRPGNALRRLPPETVRIVQRLPLNPPHHGAHEVHMRLPTRIGQ